MKAFHHSETRRQRTLALRLLAVVLVFLAPAAMACADAEQSERAETSAGNTAGTPDTGSSHVSGQAERPEGEHTESKIRVTLTEAAYTTAGIRVGSVRVDAGMAGEDLEVPGQVEFDPRRVAVISPRTAGRVERLSVVEGDRVRAGETVALLFSTAYVTAQNDLLQAVRRAKLLAGTEDEQGAHAIASAARRRLRLLGVSDGAIAQAEQSGEPRDLLPVAAPFAGTITEMHALPGEAVEAGHEMFKLADFSVVDVVAAIPERALSLVRVGQRATISIAAYPNLRFTGDVERLRGELNPETRTIQAVIHASNPTGQLIPGMFATVRLAVPGPTVARRGTAPNDERIRALTIPESAIVSDGEGRFVFVEIGPRTFERREVEVTSLAPPGSAAPVGDHVVVKGGLQAGDRIVVAGAFVLKSELAKAGLAEHGH